MIVVLVVNPSTDAVIIVSIVNPSMDAVIVARRIIGSTTMMVSVIVSPISAMITASAVITTAAVIIAAAIVTAAPATVVRSTASNQDRARRAGFGHAGIRLSGRAGAGG